MECIYKLVELIKSFPKYGINISGCIRTDIIGNANKTEFKDLKHKGMRKGCHCIESHDIGAYDTCMNGCKYCYANTNPKKAFENYKYHNPNSPLLLGEIKKLTQHKRKFKKLFFQNNVKFLKSRGKNENYNSENKNKRYID